MKINTPPLKLQFSWKMLCLALVVSEPAAALTLGELTIQSAVGQRFRGTVSYQLAPEDGLAEDCSKLSLVAPANDLPGLGQASLRLLAKERGGQILIQSADVVNEPMAGFSIKMECKGQLLQRSYTVFLDPAPLTLPSVAEETHAAARPVSSTTASRPRRAAKPVSASKDTNSQTTVVQNKQKPAEIPISLPASNGQLRIESELSFKNQAPEVLSPEELKTKIAMMQSLQEQLQSEMLRLQQSMLHLQALSGANAVATSNTPEPTSTPLATLNISSAAPPAPSEASVPTAPKRTTTNDSASSSWWMAAVMAALAAAAGAGLWLRRRQQNQTSWDADAESAISHLSRTGPKIIKPAAADADEHSLFRHSQLFYGGIEVQEEEDGSATLERAQLLVAQGETDQAIELLYQTIDENEADSEPWLLLFRVLRQQGMKTEYAQLARRFHDLGGDADDWALVRNIGYRLDPENPLYSAHEDTAETTAEPAIKENPEAETSQDLLPEPEPIAAEPLSEQDAMLMEFLSAPAAEEPPAKPSSSISPPQIISLDLPPLEFSLEEDAGSPLDISLQNHEETIEASLPLEEVEEAEASLPFEETRPIEPEAPLSFENTEILEIESSIDDEKIDPTEIKSPVSLEEAEPIEEIDLVELEIELHPPLSVFEPRKH
ncbi:type IV pilus assembly protein FimV [Iodobacter fluviatilis]|uniref:Tfp pilus assembly protein FimV n=1 Tax=Iodobacter fluviatilis TaxID=537 RepID=A0A377SUA6_9NEIS|nr:hypothetical protein [Iodobacter fluviatilis]TCU82028.1 hypothetical protein EV682_1179 [Iodobacter fluviatilis]STR44878.1 Tfp pilus assembly protein FimV [Iodobacter fluviatilis]